MRRRPSSFFFIKKPSFYLSSCPCASVPASKGYTHVHTGVLLGKYRGVSSACSPFQSGAESRPTYVLSSPRKKTQRRERTCPVGTETLLRSGGAAPWQGIGGGGDGPHPPLLSSCSRLTPALLLPARHRAFQHTGRDRMLVPALSSKYNKEDPGEEALILYFTSILLC